MIEHHSLERTSMALTFGMFIIKTPEFKCSSEHLYYSHSINMLKLASKLGVIFYHSGRIQRLYITK